MPRKPLPEEKRTQPYSLRLTRDLRERLKLLAEDSGMSLNQFIVTILEDAAEHDLAIETHVELIHKKKDE